MKKANYKALLLIATLLSSLLWTDLAFAEEEAGAPTTSQQSDAAEMTQEEPVETSSERIEEPETQEPEEQPPTEEEPAAPEVSEVGVTINAEDASDVTVQRIDLDIETPAATNTNAIVLVESEMEEVASSTPNMAADFSFAGTSTSTATTTYTIGAPTSTSRVLSSEEVIPATNAVVVQEAQEADAASSNASTTLATVSVRIHLEAFDGQLIDQTITVSECPVLPGSATTSLTAWCALEQVAAQEGWTVTPAIFGDALFVSAIDTYDGSDFNFWAFFHNDSFASLALNQYELNADDHILLTYGAFPSRLTTSSTTPLVGTTTTIVAEQFGFDSSFNAAWLPVSTATFTVNGIDMRAPSGTLDLAITSSTPYTVTATVPNSFRTDALTITPMQLQKSATVQIETPSGTLFAQSVTVPACNNGSGAQTINAKCALDAVGVQQGWPISYSQFGAQYFLQHVDEYATDFGNNLYWLWFHNETFATEAVNEYIVEEDDVLLFAYGVLPTRLSVSTTAPMVSTSIDVVAEEFGFDDSFAAAWLPATNATFTINGIAQKVVSGTLQLDITTTTAYTVTVSKNGFIPSTLTLSPSSTLTATTTPEQPCTSCDSGGGGVAPPSTPSAQEQAIDDAIAYLISQQQQNGSFGSLLFTDWVAMAYGTHESSDSAFTASKTLLTQYLTDPATAPTMPSLTDYQRHVLGLRALNQSADNYRQAILNHFDGTQFGSTSFTNDDIFAILALHELGCCRAEIEATAAYIVSQQNQHTGSIDGVDLTAAAIRALTIVYGPDHEAIAAAKQYLRSRQEPDGSIGGSIIALDTTAWTLDALGDIGETSLSTWFTETNQTPLSYLLDEQSADGSFGIQNRVWTTAYAVLALQHNWSPQRSTSVSTPSTSDGGGAVITDTASTTTDIVTSTDATVDATQATSTTDIVTTTTQIIEITTSTSSGQPESTSSSTSAIGGVIDDVTEEEIAVQRAASRRVEIEETTITSEDTEEQANPQPTSNEQEEETIIQPAPLQKTARNAAGTAAVGAGGLLIFLAWRFVQTLL